MIIRISRQFVQLVVGSTSILLAVGIAWGENSARSRALESITRSELRSHVDILADDTFEGREAGARGGQAAATYLVRQMEKLPLTPAGERGSYYQAFNGSYRNILARIEGSDPERKQEIVLISAHYDHVGYGSRRNSYGPWGYIHNGADDNASGTSALLEVAQAFSEMPTPRRTIVFAFWDAEEKGLLGSKHWVQSPTVPLKQVKCLVNVDMIGRLVNRKVEVYGSRSGIGLRQVVSQANVSLLDLDFTWDMKDDSDHWPFFLQGVPVVMFHTGLHNDYHRPSDDPERINHAGLEEVSRLLFETVDSLANAETIGPFRPAAKRETNAVRRIAEQPASPPPARLGMTWRKETSGDALKLQVLTINRGSAAELAGLRIIDYVTHFNNEAIADDLLFRQQILASQMPLTLTIERTGPEKPRDYTVNLQGTPIRVGLMSRDDAAEPGVVIVSQVVFGSPAAVAGLQVADRIEAVNGRAFHSQTEFSNLLDQSLPPILTLRVERRGQIRDVEVKLVSNGAPAP